MKKLTIVMAVLLVACSFILTVDTVSAALVYGESTVYESTSSWKFDGEAETVYVWDSGSPTGGVDWRITSGEEFGLFAFNADSTPDWTDTIKLLNGDINFGTLTFSLSETLWSATYTYNGADGNTMTQSLSLGASLEWGFYFSDGTNKYYTGNTSGIPTSITDYGISEISSPENTFELIADNMKASVSTSPIPIPTAGLLLMSGLMGLAGVRTRFKKN